MDSKEGTSLFSLTKTLNHVYRYTSTHKHKHICVRLLGHESAAEKQDFNLQFSLTIVNAVLKTEDVQYEHMGNTIFLVGWTGNIHCHPLPDN